MVLRTSEIGVRGALGARQIDVLWLILRQVAGMTMVGLTIGVPAAIASTQLIRVWLYGVESSDPLSVAGAAVGMTVVALMAVSFPARRAARLDPLKDLRYEVIENTCDAAFDIDAAAQWADPRRDVDEEYERDKAAHRGRYNEAGTERHHTVGRLRGRLLQTFLPAIPIVPQPYQERFAGFGQGVRCDQWGRPLVHMLYLVTDRAPARTSANAAAVQAAYAMLLRLYPAQATTLTTRREASIAALMGVERSESVQRGVSRGLPIRTQSSAFQLEICRSNPTPDSCWDGARCGLEGGRQIVSGGSWREMLRVRSIEEDWTSGTGLGFDVNRVNGKTCAGHTGGYLAMPQRRSSNSVTRWGSSSSQTLTT